LATARLYYADTTAEYKVGQRSTLDLLVGEQTLTTTQITLAQARHDTYIAEAALLSAIGRLEADQLVLNQPTFDAVAAFKKVSHGGALPWDMVTRFPDSVGAPGRGPAKPLAAPGLPARPQLIEGAPIPDGAAPATRDPTTPLPRTTSPATPLRIDSTRVVTDTPS
jgi:outer membrane protein